MALEQGLRIRDLSFRYKRSGPEVLRGISWDVSVGRNVLLGPNGAGKSTLLALCATALDARNGTIFVNGCDSAQRSNRLAFRRSIGWMPQDIRPIAGLTSREQVAYVGWLKGLGRGDAWRQAGRLLDQVALGEDADRPAGDLSGGQRRRLGLAQALMGAPTVLLLDEPSAGLDPAQRARFREIIATLDRSITVLVSTHQVDDLTELFDHVVVIHAGSLVWDGTVETFMALAPEGAQRPAEAAYAQIVPGVD